ncbi:CopG family ribbon-helix-helix protein [Pseudomonas lopnurensis]
MSIISPALRRRSPHWIMLEAIQQYVEREEAHESFKQEALASWAAYRETGRHLTGQEVRDWLNTWGTGDEKAVPGCHE